MKNINYRKNEFYLIFDENFLTLIFQFKIPEKVNPKTVDLDMLSWSNNSD